MDTGPHPIQNDLILKVSEDGKFVQAQFTASITRKPIETAWFKQQISALGLDKAELNQDAIGLCIKQYNGGTTNSTINIGSCIDGKLEVQTAKDDMEAFIIISPAHGGSGITQDTVEQTLLEQGIVAGIMTDAIRAAVNQQNGQKTLVAQGKPVIHGKDGYFVKLIPDIVDRRPKIDDKGIAHYNEIATFVTVNKGDQLVRRHPATSGVEGRNIKGEAISATPGEDLMFGANLPGTSISPDNPNLLLAAIVGQPVMQDNGAIVEPTITVENVDSKTGNIDFDGSVVVGSNVTTGMKIQVSGDIHVMGMIEEATTVNAGGNIVVKNGVVGRGSVNNDDGKPGNGVAKLTAKGNICAKFIENSLVDAQQNVMVDELIAHSAVTAKLQVSVGRKGAKRGHIMGGVIIAGKLVEAEVLGSPAGVNTKVHVATDTIAATQLAQVNNLLSDKNKQRESIERTYSVALRTQKNNKSASFLHNLKTALQQIDTEMQSLSASKERLQHEVELLQKAQIRIKRAVYNAVEFQIYTAQDKTSEEKAGGIFYLDNNVIAYKPI